MGEGGGKERAGGLGAVRQEVCGASRLLIRDPQCHCKRMFYQDVIFPTADAIFFLMQTVLTFEIRHLVMLTLRQPKHEAGGKKFLLNLPPPQPTPPSFPLILSKFSCTPPPTSLGLAGLFLPSSNSAQRSQEGMWPRGGQRRESRGDSPGNRGAGNRFSHCHVQARAAVGGMFLWASRGSFSPHPHNLVWGFKLEVIRAFPTPRFPAQ